MGDKDPGKLPEGCCKWTDVDENLKNISLKRFGIVGDGNCFFYSLADQILERSPTLKTSVASGSKLAALLNTPSLTVRTSNGMPTALAAKLREEIIKEMVDNQWFYS